MSNQGGGNANRWDVMSIREYEDRTGQAKTQWTKIGVAFTNKNGSINVQLDCLPLDGKCQLQVPLSREEREALFNNKQQGGGQQSGNQGGGGGYQQRGQQRQQGGFGGNRQQQGNPRNAGQQQRQQAQQRFGQRGQSAPQQGGFAPTQQYAPDPDAEMEGGYIEADPQQGQESGWMVGSVWITDARNLPKDHPDFIPF